MSPPKRDKFAALAAQQQQSKEDAPPVAAASTNTSVSPKRDKFAALAHRHQQPEAAATPTAAPSVVSTPVAAAKRDKFAALAQKQQTPPVAASTSSSQQVAPAPKRDKFAALAQHQQATTPSSSSTNVVVAAAAPKRDKLAALAARQAATSSSSSNSQPAVQRPSPMKRDKFSALQQRPVETEPVVATTQPQDPRDAQANAVNEALMTKCHARDEVWKDLERAEALTVQLLQYAEETADHMAVATTASSHHGSVNSNKTNGPLLSLEQAQTILQGLGTKYQDCLSQIHATLEPHANLVQAYKPQTARVNRMYHGRLELALAQSKRTLLQELLDEEQKSTSRLSLSPEETNGISLQVPTQDAAAPVTTGKRPREDD